jgi:hypothetical protein
MDLKAYANAAGKKYTTLYDKVKAYRVLAVTHMRNADARDQWRNLAEIHAAPEWLWPALVAQMIGDSWTVAKTRDTDDVAALRRKLAAALSEIARLNKEGDRLAVENGGIKRRLKAKETRETDLCKRLDAAVAERDQARKAKVQAEADLALSRR